MGFRSLLEGDEPEWGGSFALSGNSHTWHMQQVGCKYADPSMKLIFFKTSDASKQTMQNKKNDATTLMNGNSCTDVEAGGTISSITTAGIDTLVVYAQMFLQSLRTPSTILQWERQRQMSNRARLPTPVTITTLRRHVHALQTPTGSRSIAATLQR